MAVAGVFIVQGWE